MAAAPLRLAAVLLLALATAIPAWAQSKPGKPPAGPTLSAAREIMAGAMLSVFLSRAPAGARLAIARPADPASAAIVVVEATRPAPSLQTPGAPGSYELRLTAERNGAPEVLLRQPLVTTEPTATLAAPARVGRGQALPARGIGPNGEQDRVVLVAPEQPDDAQGPQFFPAENVEATLEAPETPGRYELRYVMHAPLAEHRILARQTVTVD
jgi:Ca-activated chloride channel family protein